MRDVAIIGGDDRILGNCVRAFTGDDSDRLVKAAQSGTIRGVVALSKWMHGALKNGLRSLPQGVRVVYYPHSINSLRDDLPRLVQENFPNLPAMPETKRQLPPPAAAAPKTTLGQALTTALDKQEAEKQQPKIDPNVKYPFAKKEEPKVYVGVDWEPLSEGTIAQTLKANRAGFSQGGQVSLWTKEEQEALMLARTEVETAMAKEGRTRGGLLEETKKIFVELGGNPNRSAESIAERCSRIRRAEEEKRKAEARKEQSRRAGLASAMKRAAEKETKESLRSRMLAGSPIELSIPPVAHTNGHAAVTVAPPVGARHHDAVDHDRLVRVLRHVREAVDLGYRTKEQAFDDICAQLDRLLEG